jgi:hypothetical protein
MAAAMQIAGLVLLILIMQIDWATYLRRWSRRPDHGSERAGDSGP